MPFDPCKPLLDAYATLIDMRPSPFTEAIVDQTFDWNGIQTPRHIWSDTIICESHVWGFGGCQMPASSISCCESLLGALRLQTNLRAMRICSIRTLRWIGGIVRIAAPRLVRALWMLVILVPGPGAFAARHMEAR